MVTADKRKGKVVLFTSEDDSLTHFQWHDREKNEVVIDLIVINDAYLEKIEKCTTGRVYILRFTSSDKKMFFWMQEPKEENDADLIKKFNEAVGAEIPKKGASGNASAPAPGAQAPAAGSNAANSANAGMHSAQVQQILQQFLESQAAQGARAAPVPLGAVLTTDALQGLLTDETACAEMMALLPDGHKSTEDLREVLGSPQLQQSMHSLSQAIHSDQLPTLFSSLGLNPSAISQAAPGSDALEILCKTMEANSKKDEPKGPEGPSSGSA